MADRKIALYIAPATHHFLGDRLFVLNDGRLNGDRINAPYVHLAKFFAARGIAVHTADFLPGKETGDVLNVYVSMGMRNHYRKLSRRRDVVLSAFFAMECPIVEPALYCELPTIQRYFKRVFSWSDSAALEPFVGGALRLEHMRWPQSFDDVHEEIWRRTDRKFLVMINTNRLPRLYWKELYTERLGAIEYFGQFGEIDLYGNNWNAPPYRACKIWMPYTLVRVHRKLLQYWDRVRPDPHLAAARRVYRGPATSKAETLGQYKFAICFENSILKGWITEKIFDCFFAGAVPIYWGAPEIETVIPRECFIDMRRFADYDELRDYLKSLTEGEIAEYKENARAFLKSPQYQPFTQQAFVAHFARIVQEDAGESQSERLGLI